MNIEEIIVSKEKYLEIYFKKILKLLIFIEKELKDVLDFKIFSSYISLRDNLEPYLVITIKKDYKFEGCKRIYYIYIQNNELENYEYEYEFLVYSISDEHNKICSSDIELRDFLDIEIKQSLTYSKNGFNTKSLFKKYLNTCFGYIENIPNLDYESILKFKMNRKFR